MDIEEVVIDHLNHAGVGATAYPDVPRKRPTTFVVVERTGGPRTDIVVERPMLDIQCWATERRDAALLADAVADALRAMPDAVAECFHVNITSNYRDADLESGTPRYHVVCEITFVNN